MNKSDKSSNMGPAIIFLCATLVSLLGVVVIAILKNPAVAIIQAGRTIKIVSIVLWCLVALFFVLTLVLFFLSFKKSKGDEDDVLDLDVEEDVESDDESLSNLQKAGKAIKGVVSTAKDHPAAATAAITAAVLLPVVTVGLVKSAKKKREEKKQAKRIREIFLSLFSK